MDDEEKNRILRSLHNDPVGGSHYGQTATLGKVCDRFWWPKVSYDVKAFVRGCGDCQKANPSNKSQPSTLHPLKVSHIFHRWGIDVVQ